ncbi:MAG: choice-of-anchor D domain-containing protein [Muribaculaceae bacterium]|nr:choice-of-anchor D domain-containing protein [Muribaculaceae bacterium]
MRQFKLLFLLAFLACFAGAQADELTVGDGATTSSYLPIYGIYLDTEGAYDQMIYPKSALEDMGGMSITSVEFYPTAAFADKLAGVVLQISMMETDLDQMAYENYIYQPFDDADFYVCGTYTIIGGEEYLVFNLDNTFEYSGNKNLVIQTKVITPGSWNTIYFKGDDQTNKVGYYHNGSSGNSSFFLPMATFEYEGESKPYNAKVSPSALDFGSIEEKTDLTMTVKLKNIGENAFTPALSGLEAPFSTTWEPAELAAGESVEIPVKFAPETLGDYTGTLTVNCGEAGSFNVALSGTAIEHVDEVTVGNGSATNTYVPIFGSYIDTQGTYSQIIYDKNSIAELAGTEITSVKFFAANLFPTDVEGAVLEVALCETDVNAFTSSSPTPIATDEFTVCGSYTMTSTDNVMTFELDDAFEYSGDKNLAVMVSVTTTSGYMSFPFYGVNLTDYISLYAYESWSGMNKTSTTFLPKTTFGYNKLNQEYAARVTKNLAFGKLDAGTEATLNVTVENKGTNAFTPALSTLETPFSTTWTPVELAAGESVEIPVKFAPETPGEYSGTLTVNCGEAGSFDVALSGRAIEPGSEITVCEGSEINNYIPIYGMYYDTQNTQSQFIYPASKLTALQGRAITSVKFFHRGNLPLEGGQLQVSVKETEQTIFERETAVAKPNEITDMTAVAAVTLSKNTSELEIIFSEPFAYNGGNLAFETLVLSKGNYATTAFLGENQTVDCAFNTYNTTSGLFQFLPMIEFSTIAAAPVGEETTLASILENGEEDKVYTISEPLALVQVAEAAPSAYLSNGTDWIRVDLNVDGLTTEENIALLNAIDNTKAIKAGVLTGAISNRETAPKLTVTALPAELVGEDDAPDCDVIDLDLTADLRDNMPKPGQVLNVLGYYNNGAITAYSGLNGAVGQSIELINDLTEPLDYETASHYRLTLAIELKQPWETENASSGAPKRAKTTDDTAFENLKGQVLGGSLDISTGVTDVNAKAVAVSVKYVNAAGMVSNHPFDGINIVVTTNDDGTTTVSKMVK